MVSRFKSILRLEVFHSYYKDGICRDLRFFPTKETSAVLKHYGLIYYPFESGFQLLSEKPDFTKLADYIKSTTSIESFKVDGFAVSNNFYLYTQYPLNKQGYYNYHSNGIDKEAFNGAMVMQPKFQETSQNDQLLTLTFDLNDLKNVSENYCLRYKARKSRWQYFIINRSKQSFDELLIKSKGPDPVTFINKGEQKLKNGKSGTLFTSESESLLTTAYTRYNLDLVQLKTSNATTKSIPVFNGLPVPRPENLVLSKDNAESDSSIIYVYV